jgi:hypothetical protein
MAHEVLSKGKILMSKLRELLEKKVIGLAGGQAALKGKRNGAASKS